MSTPTSDDLRFARLAALADEDPDAVLDTAGHDAARADTGGADALAARIAEQRKLREACAGAVDTSALRCPDAVRARVIAALGEADQTSDFRAGSDPASSPAIEDQPAVAGRIGPRRWIGVFAAAALIAVSTVAMVGTLRTLRTAPSPVGVAQVVPVLNARQAGAFDARHQVCGSDPTELFDYEQFPKNLSELDGRLTEIIDSSLASAQLDLSDLGYHYAGAGNCNVPGSGAVHIVYRNDVGKSLSLWLRSSDGNLSLQPGQVYGPPADSAQAGRILVWLDGDVVLYLVGDLPEDVSAARPQLALHPAQPLATRAGEARRGVYLAETAR